MPRTVPAALINWASGANSAATALAAPAFTPAKYASTTSVGLVMVFELLLLQSLQGVHVMGSRCLAYADRYLEEP